MVGHSVTPDYLVCLEDGRKFESLKRHLRTKYDMSPEEYRTKWGLPKDYPMVAPNYAAAVRRWPRTWASARVAVSRRRPPPPAASARRSPPAKSNDILSFPAAGKESEVFGPPASRRPFFLQVSTLAKPQAGETPGRKSDRSLAERAFQAVLVY